MSMLVEENYTEDPDKSTPLRALWAGVLTRALQDLTIARPHLRNNAWHWFTDEKQQGTGSFAFVCDILDLDKAKILTKLNKEATK